MALLFQAIVFLAVRYSHAAPVPLTNPTSDGEPPYGPAPNFRGSINIFLSSIITLTLCVYTSIHLNITPEKRYYGIKTVWIYKFYWVLIALVAPEFVLYSAYMQWRNAQELCKQLRQLDPPNTSTQSDTGDAATTLPRSKQPSFAMDISNMSDDIDYEYLALTPKGFMEFARAKLITPDILDGKDIADRSKADSLGKLLVCIQALWMVVNCIARKANGLPTTLVELNVVVHVVVAVVVYLLWWYKPLAVAHPTILRKQDMTEVDPLADRQLGDSGSDSLVKQACTTTDPPNYTVKGSIHTGGVLGMRFNSKISNDIGLQLVSTLLSCIYAGCHATAWSSHFPSYIERWIWRGSCIWIAAGIPFIDLCLRFLQSLIGRRVAKLGRTLLTLPILLGIALYVVARLFIVVEAFISMRNLPIGSFKTVQWLELWPHV
ncbi:hypothetical protein K440DRAFT_552218 [Wilcoxina mikolae CBS 423.85]|nr:hypothetical protein K440DRAFT_552218 [Wilcoxina mikolae CBS 423.85]